MTDELRDVLDSVRRAERRYRRHKPDTTLFEHDDMIDLRNPKTQAHYFEVGREALSLVLRSMVLCQKASVQSVLDMPCGFGRELRHFVGAFPKADFYACELYEDKITYCAQQFGATPVLSSDDFDSISFDRLFDLVWSGSLLSHLPQERYLPALAMYSRVLAPGGIALITLQGRNTPHFQEVEYKYMDDERMADAIASFQATGWGHAPYQTMENFGISFALPSFIISHLERDPTLSLRAYIERGWDDHQDVVIFQKEAIDHKWSSLGQIWPLQTQPL